MRDLRRSIQPRVASSSGFTLIELVIAIAIVGILTIIAIPSYQQYVMRTNRAVGKTLITDIVQRQEAWFGDRKSYTCLSNLYAGLANCGSVIYASSDGSPQSSTTTSTLYNFQVYQVASTGTTTVSTCSVGNTTMTSSGQYKYVVVATPMFNQLASDTLCGTLCVSSTGERGASGTNGTTCWSR